MDRPIPGLLVLEETASFYGALIVRLVTTIDGSPQHPRFQILLAAPPGLDSDWMENVLAGTREHNEKDYPRRFPKVLGSMLCSSAAPFSLKMHF